MEKTTIVAIVLGILVLISAVQAVQLSGLKEKISEGSLSSSEGGSFATSAGPERTGALPKSVKDLPQMVGGC